MTIKFIHCNIKMCNTKQNETERNETKQNIDRREEKKEYLFIITFEQFYRYA